MSECVVRMEMPKNCCHCPMIAYADKIKWVDNSRETEGAYICLFTKELIDNTKRADNCPIICQLPEGHGRLVDIDKPFLEVMQIGHMVQIIVPAERSET